MHHRLLIGAVIGALALSACGGSNSGPAVIPGSTAGSQAASTASGPAVSSRFRDQLAKGEIRPSCGTPAAGDDARCFAYELVGGGRTPQGAVHPNAAPAGYGPAQLQAAYGTASIAGTGGAGRLVAIVDAYDAKTLEADLGVYRSQYGLPPCTTANGCFKKVNQNGGTSLPRANASWEQETSLDVDMVSANCPNCHILVVEASSASFTNLAAAVNTAAKLGAVVISNSYGGGESAAYASSYNHPGVAITVSNGDSGYGPASPADYASVIAVGGTSLSTASNARGWSETVWSGSGSGCSTVIAKPSWQKDTGCANRTIGDVAYIGDPNTGVAVYDSTPYNGSSGWLVFGGTSVGSPAIGAIFALAGNTVSNASGLYAASGGLNDVTSGSNGTCSVAYLCNGEVGYDGPTGNGTPAGTSAF